MATVMDYVDKGFDILNPISEKLGKTGKAAIECLIDNGFSKKDVVKFIYATEKDVEKHYDKVLHQRLEEIKKRKRTRAT